MKNLVSILVSCMATLSAQSFNLTPPTPLLKALSNNETSAGLRLLENGADPNEQTFVGFAPVFFPVLHQNLKLLRSMKDRGANLRVKDKSGANLLMWAAFSETGDAALVEELLRLGLDPNEPDQKGETALTWALRRGGDTPAVRVLRKAGALDQASTRRAIERAISLLQSSSAQFTKVSGCSSCHHQSLPQMANGIARTRSLAVDEQTAQKQVKAVISTYRPLLEEMLQGKSRVPNAPISASYALIGLGAEGYAPDEITQAMAHLIGSQQQQDGSFRILPGRPPLEVSDVSATALSIRALQIFGTSPQDKIRRAADWLKRVEPRTMEDRTMQLLGLHWADAGGSSLVRKLAVELLKLQNQDGGWSQLRGLSSDSYATGQALVALEQSGAANRQHPAFIQGVEFLLRTQMPDGSWLVRTRTYPFQPYKESGFPYGKDQWISAAGTSWAVMALSLSLPPAIPGVAHPSDQSVTRESPAPGTPATQPR